MAFLIIAPVVLAKIAIIKVVFEKFILLIFSLAINLTDNVLR